MKSVPKYKLTRRMISELVSHELLSTEEKQMYRKISGQSVKSVLGHQVYLITLMLTLKERERRFTEFLERRLAA
jgi:hypothetical protein